MDVVGEAISRALAYLTEERTPEEAYRKAGYILQEVGRGHRLASDSEIRQIVSDNSSWATMVHGEPTDKLVDPVTKISIEALRRRGLYTDEEQVRQAVKQSIESGETRLIVRHYRDILGLDD